MPVIVAGVLTYKSTELVLYVDKLYTAAEAKIHSGDDVKDKSTTSSQPHHCRFTPDSGVEMTDVKNCGYVDEHAFEHSFLGFPSPVGLRTTGSSSTSANRSCTYGRYTQISL